MYFWKIDKLKEDLVAGKVGERESLSYLLWTYFCVLVAGETSYLMPNEAVIAPDIGMSASYILFTLLGTIWVFDGNGGREGKDFLKRYLSIGWVVGWRCAILFFAVLIIGGMLFVDYFEEQTQTSWFDVVVVSLFYIFLFWRVRVHVAEVAKETSS